MNERNYNVEILHSQLDPRERRKRFGAFVQGYAEVLLCTDALLLENDIKGCSLCVQYRLPLRSLGNFLHRSWKMGGKNDSRFQSKSILLHYEEDEPLLETLRTQYHVPITPHLCPSDEENQEAMVSSNIRVRNSIRKPRP